MLVVLYGMPGSGKSHLINWLKIKYDNEIENNDLRMFYQF